MPWSPVSHAEGSKHRPGLETWGPGASRQMFAEGERSRLFAEVRAVVESGQRAATSTGGSPT